MIVSLHHRESAILAANQLAMTLCCARNSFSGPASRRLLALPRRYQHTEISRSRRGLNKRLDAGPLNEFLAQAESHCELIRGKDGALSVVQRYDHTNPNGVLGPLAEGRCRVSGYGRFSPGAPVRGSGLCVVVLRPHQGPPPALVQHGRLRQSR